MARATLLLALLAGCGTAPYPDYWEDEGPAPTVTGVAPDSVDNVFGGQEIVLSGSGLASTTTVVIGSRNATILETTATSVTVEVPPHVPGGGVVEVAVVTEDGSVWVDGWRRPSPTASPTASGSPGSTRACPWPAWTARSR
ncbi:MAG: IPT/TIG domain-containing protein [Deltaproteobacteria bacterium]|nr:IPT/TIG domain-containing protein [Deltaproteobacteria bacterium]